MKLNLNCIIEGTPDVKYTMKWLVYYYYIVKLFYYNKLNHYILNQFFKV